MKTLGNDEVWIFDREVMAETSMIFIIFKLVIISRITANLGMNESLSISKLIYLIYSSFNLLVWGTWSHKQELEAEGSRSSCKCQLYTWVLGIQTESQDVHRQVGLTRTQGRQQFGQWHTWIHNHLIYCLCHPQIWPIRASEPKIVESGPKILI